MPPQIWGYEEVLRRYYAFSNACPEPTGLVSGDPARNHRVNVLNLTEKNYGRWIFWFSQDSAASPPPPQIEEISSNEEVVGYEISGIRTSVELPVCFLGRSRCQVHVDIVVSYVAQFLSPRFESKDALCHLLIWGDLLKKIENPKIESWKDSKSIVTKTNTPVRQFPTPLFGTFLMVLKKCCKAKLLWTTFLNILKKYQKENGERFSMRAFRDHQKH